MAVDPDRSAVRAAGRLARRSIDGEDRVRREAALIDHLRSMLSLQRSNSPRVGVFVAHDGEPDLMPLVQWLWSQSITVALPVLSDGANDHTMRFVPWLPDDELQHGRFNIPVPPERDAVEPSTLLVSLVGFDRHGNRIGRGGGFFDRHLADTRSTIVGVGFEAQRFDKVPVEAHDMALPTVVTDLGVRFNAIAPST